MLKEDAPQSVSLAGASQTGASTGNVTALNKNAVITLFKT